MRDWVNLTNFTVAGILSSLPIDEHIVHPNNLVAPSAENMFLAVVFVSSELV
jgi:hypothetical protein